MAVRTGGGHGQQVAAGHVVRQVGILDDDVPGLTVLADHAGEDRRGGGDTGGQRHGVVGLVEDRAGIVRHAPVHGDVASRMGGALVTVHGHGLADTGLVQGEGGRAGDGAAGLD